MKITELHSDYVGQQNKTTPPPKIAQEKSNSIGHYKPSKPKLKWSKTVKTDKIGQARPKSGLQIHPKRKKSKGKQKTAMIKSMFTQWPTREINYPSEKPVVQPAKSMQERIEALIARSGLSYYDLAKTMGVTRSTVHDIRHGKREASKKFIAKFDLAEKRIDAARHGDGILTRKGEALLVYAITAPPSAGETDSPTDTIHVTVSPTDTEPNPEPIELKLTKPPIGIRLAAIIRALTHEKCDDLLLLCLDKDHNTQAFIEKLSPNSFLYAIRKVVQLCLGLDWKKELQMLVEDAEKRRASTLSKIVETTVEPKSTEQGQTTKT